MQEIRMGMVNEEVDIGKFCIQEQLNVYSISWNTNYLYEAAF